MEGYAVVYADWNRELGEQAERELAKAAATVNDLKVTTEVLFGHVASGIVDAAATNETDLIVMGTHGRGAMLHLVMGNVAERVVRVAPCPVLTVRQPKAPGQPARARGGTGGVPRGSGRNARARAGGEGERLVAPADARRRGVPDLLRKLPWHGCARRRSAGQLDDPEAREP